MKQDYLFKEKYIEDQQGLNQMLAKGFFIVGGGQYNRLTNTIDYHLRRTFWSILFRNFKRKNI
jgi:hypothetical protein